uniref:Type II protein arginine methyltransferase n=1 Tax=Heterorhabditis bacteriophora TaxID=37862 RepID=A0A1I7WKP7_HETBA
MGNMHINYLHEETNHYCKSEFLLIVLQQNAFLINRQKFSAMICSSYVLVKKIELIKCIVCNKSKYFHLFSKLSNISALRIVHVRCQAMHECNQLIRSGMLTVFRFNIHGIMYLGIIIRTFVFLHREKGEMDICEIANYLFCGVTMLFKLVIRLCINFSLYYIYLNTTGSSGFCKYTEIFYNINKIPNQIQQLLYRKHQVILIYQTKFPLHIVVNFILIMQDYKFPRFVEVGPGRQLGTMLLQVSKKAYHYSC